MSISHLGHAGRMAALDAALARKADRAAAIASYKHVEEEFEEYRIPTYRPAAGESPAR